MKNYDGSYTSEAIGMVLPLFKSFVHVHTEVATVPRPWFTPMTHGGGLGPASYTVLCAWGVLSSPFNATWETQHIRWPVVLSHGWPLSLRCLGMSRLALAPFIADSRDWAFPRRDLPFLAGQGVWHRADESWASREHQVIKGLPIPILGLRNSPGGTGSLHVAACLRFAFPLLTTPRDISTLQFCRGTSLRCRVWLQVHRDLGSRAAQRERAVWRHRAASPAPEGQQGKEWEAAGVPETEREHPKESQALLGQNSCQEQQEHGLQTQVQVLPWPIGTLRTLDSARACGILWTLSNYVVGQSINLY